MRVPISEVLPTATQRSGGSQPNALIVGAAPSIPSISSDPRRARRSSLFLADLTDATLAGSEWDDDEAGDRPWQWATLCNTVMPADAVVSGDRDCPR